MKTGQLSAFAFEPAKDRSAVALENNGARQIDCDRALVFRAQFEVSRFEQLRVRETQRTFNPQRRRPSRLTVDLSNSCSHALCWCNGEATAPHCSKSSVSYWARRSK